MCHFQVPLASGTYWNTLSHEHAHTHLHNALSSLMHKSCFFTYCTPLSSLHFGCMQEFAVKVLFVLVSLCVCVCVFIECCVRYIYLFPFSDLPLSVTLCLSLCLSFRFGARSTGSRRGEKRLIFQYVILDFFVNKCVFPYSLVCVCL